MYPGRGAVRKGGGIGFIERPREGPRINREALKPTVRQQLRDVGPPAIRVQEASVDADMAPAAYRARVERPPIIFRVKPERLTGLLAAHRAVGRLRQRAIRDSGSDDGKRPFTIRGTEAVVIAVGAHAAASPRMR